MENAQKSLHNVVEHLLSTSVTVRPPPTNPTVGLRSTLYCRQATNSRYILHEYTSGRAKNNHPVQFSADREGRLFVCVCTQWREGLRRPRAEAMNCALHREGDAPSHSGGGVPGRTGPESKTLHIGNHIY